MVGFLSSMIDTKMRDVKPGMGQAEVIAAKRVPKKFQITLSQFCNAPTVCQDVVCLSSVDPLVELCKYPYKSEKVSNEKESKVLLEHLLFWTGVGKLNSSEASLLFFLPIFFLQGRHFLDFLSYLGQHGVRDDSTSGVFCQPLRTPAGEVRRQVVTNRFP